MFNFSRILVMAPHTDDGEFGCGGSIHKWVNEGKEVYYVAFSSAAVTMPQPMPPDILKQEIKEATRILGIKTQNLILLNYQIRTFPTYRQEILEDMIRLREELKPDVVLLPSANDTHQDHQTISSEGFRAFKRISILGYEMPYNNLNFNTSLFVALEKENLRKKVEALLCYKSQVNRVFLTEDFIRSLATVRGTQIGFSYAEAFEVIRLVIR